MIFERLAARQCCRPVLNGMVNKNVLHALRWNVIWQQTMDACGSQNLVLLFLQAVDDTCPQQRTLACSRLRINENGSVRDDQREKLLCLPRATEKPITVLFFKRPWAYEGRIAHPRLKASHRTRSSSQNS